MAESQSKESHKLGYLDPKIEGICRDSPTLNRTSKMILLQVISSMGWGLESFDIKVAFLQGQPQSDRVMATVTQYLNADRPCEWVHIDREVKQGCLYGLIDAPYLWHCALVTELIKLGFEPTPFDPCLCVIRNPPDDEKAGSLAGILGIHVDDGIGGGNEFVSIQDQAFRAEFPLRISQNIRLYIYRHRGDSTR